MSTLNERIKNRRKELGLTQKELADMLSISDKTVSRWESSNQMPDAILIPDIAQCLQTTLDDLYGIKENIHQQFDDNTSKIFKYPKEKLWLSLSYKISMLLSLFVVLMGCIFNLTYRFDYADKSIRKAGTILIIVGFVVLLLVDIVYNITYRDKRIYNPIYLKSDIFFVGFTVLSLIPLLYIADVRYDVFVALALAIMYKVVITLQKRKLKEHNILIDNKTTKILSILFIVLTLVFTTVVVFFKFFYYQYFFKGPVTVAIGLQTMSNQSSVSSGIGLPYFTYAMGLSAIIYIILIIEYIKLCKKCTQEI